MISDFQLMTTDEVAGLLRVSAETVRQLAADGALPGRKIGRAWRFPRQGVENFALETRQPSTGGAPVAREKIRVDPTVQD